MLKTKREQEKKEWMNVYSQFCKVIGMKHKHKGYFKQIFKKKIRPDEEKEPYTRMATILNVLYYDLKFYLINIGFNLTLIY